MAQLTNNPVRILLNQKIWFSRKIHSSPQGVSISGTTEPEHALDHCARQASFSRRSCGEGAADATGITVDFVCHLLGPRTGWLVSPHGGPHHAPLRGGIEPASRIPRSLSSAG